VALIIGALYLAIGRVFALPGDNARQWRLAAWLVSGVVFAMHICYEHFRLRSSTRSTAMHAAVAAAIGAGGLALAGMIRSVSTGAPLRPAWLLALVLWPAFTAVPAFLVALAAAAALARLKPNSPEKVR
jgi:hypothetical protein